MQHGSKVYAENVPIAAKGSCVIPLVSTLHITVGACITCWPAAPINPFTLTSHNNCLPSLLSLPKDPLMKQRWMRALHRMEPNSDLPFETGCICSHHFASDDYSHYLSGKRLKSNSVPSIHIPRFRVSVHPKSILSSFTSQSNYQFFSVLSSTVQRIWLPTTPHNSIHPKMIPHRVHRLKVAIVRKWPIDRSANSPMASIFSAISIRKRLRVNNGK